MEHSSEGQVLYIVYQPIPHRQRIYMWINGDNRRESTKMESFRKWIIDSGQEFLIPTVMTTLNTHSFYLWDKTHKKVYYLQPNIHSNDFKKPLTEEIKEDYRDKERIKKEKMEDPLKRALINLLW